MQAWWKVLNKVKKMWIKKNIYFNKLYCFINVLDNKSKHGEKALNRSYFLESVNQSLTKNKKGRAFNFSALFFTEKCPNLHPKDYSYIERFDVAISLRNLQFWEMRDLGNKSCIKTTIDHFHILWYC